MHFRILNDDSSGEFTYLLADPTTREAVLIDPHGRDLPVLSALLSDAELRLRWILRTHHHDVAPTPEREMLSQLGAPLVQGDEPSDALASVGLMRDALLFGDEVMHVVSTPGHTRSCLSFVWRDRFFCGGLLSVTACPHQPHPQVPEALWDSVMQKVFTLADETLLFAGHEQRTRAVSTVLEQRRWHPYFSGLTRDEFLAQMSALSERVLPAPIFEE